MGEKESHEFLFLLLHQNHQRRQRLLWLLVAKDDNHALSEGRRGSRRRGQGQPDAEHEGQGEREEGLSALHQVVIRALNHEGRLQGVSQDLRR